VSEHTLRFPCDIADEIGLHTNEINAFKRQGCLFYGRKTSVAWVREYLHKITDPGEQDPASKLQPAVSNARGRKRSK